VGTSTRRWSRRSTPCAARLVTRDVAQLSGGEKRAGCADQGLLLAKARHPAARRADQSPGCRNRSPGSSAISRNMAGLHHAGDPTTATSLDKPHGVDAGARIAGRACPTRAITRTGWSRRPSASRSRRAREEAKQRTLRARAGMDPLEPQGAAGQVGKGRASRPYDKLAEEASREQTGKAQIQIPPGPRLGGGGGGGGRPVEGVRRPAAGR